jgi:hypothetical protein
VDIALFNFPLGENPSRWRVRPRCCIRFATLYYLEIRWRLLLQRIFPGRRAAIFCLRERVQMGLSFWHWMVVFFVIGIPIAVICGLMWFVLRASKGAMPLRPTETRLWELTNLKSKGLITDAEYEQQRAAILRKI